MQEAKPKTEYLSTVGEINPLRVLERFGKGPVVLCIVAIWTRGAMTGNLEEKGAWTHSFWNAVLTTLPEVGGCRLSWNTLFFAMPSTGIAEAVNKFSDLLRTHQDACLETFCVLCEVKGEAEHKIDVLDVMGHEVCSERDFGSSREYRLDGHRFYHLRDGKPYPTK